jgi:hypothetical protein
MTCFSIMIGIIVAAIVQNVIGAIWYAPSVFGSLWMKESNVTPKPDTMMRAMIGSTIAALLTAAVMACFMYRFNIVTAVSAFHFSWMAWLGFVAAITAQGVLFAGWSTKLYLLNNGYNLVSLIAMAQILVVALNW